MLGVGVLVRGFWELYQDGHEVFEEDGIGADRLEDASGKSLY